METYIKELYLLGEVIGALLLGGVLGWQRIHWGRAAGPRTYGLVSAGAALFTILSLRAFAPDVARVAAGIVTGIGFLGVGTILRRESHVEGLTTAAGMWMAAAIGMAMGTGYYILAVASTLMVLVVFMLKGEDKLEQKNKKKK